MVTQERLPTRVNRACRRCRRNKTRCDAARPCTLCLRAGVHCEAADIPPSSTFRSLRSRLRPETQRRSRGSINGNPSRQDTDVADQESARGDNEWSSGIEQPDRPCLTTQGAVRATTSRAAEAPRYAEAESAMGIVRKIYKLDRERINDSSTSAIPDGTLQSTASVEADRSHRLSISTILNCRFPDESTIGVLMEDYFEAVHWFSLVIHEPQFRKGLIDVQDGYAYVSETPFLLLLSTVLAMAAWYRSYNSSADDAETYRQLSNQLLSVVEARLVQIMDQHSLTAIQTCILLGSHHVYHGRPNLSLSLLGATVKMAHSLNLHRCVPYGSPAEVEERKRVWWTIYTWDRFASVSYGRPLSIDDETCDVPMPDIFSELPCFRKSSSELSSTHTIYSPYQIELSKLYALASPALKMIFGTFRIGATNQASDMKYSALIEEVTERLSDWYNHLPIYLKLNLNREYNSAEATWTSRAHTLQSLALQLTFDNLLIVLYRPLLSQQAESLSTMSVGTPDETQIDAPEIDTSQSDLFHTAYHGRRQVSEHWWSAAVRTARVTELPHLAQLATRTHLVAFMAMNLFHSAIVLVLNALSNPLSDRTQGVKRTLTRILRLQENTGRRSTFSRQSSAVLRNLVGLLLRIESEAMLGITEGAIEPRDDTIEPGISSNIHSPLLSTEDALRLPQDVASAESNLRHVHIPSVGTNSLGLSEGLAAVQKAFPCPFEANLDFSLSFASKSAEHWPAASSELHDADSSSCNPNRYNQTHIAENNPFWLWDVPLG